MKRYNPFILPSLLKNLDVTYLEGLWFNYLYFRSPLLANLSSFLTNHDQKIEVTITPSTGDFTFIEIKKNK